MKSTFKLSAGLKMAAVLAFVATSAHAQKWGNISTNNPTFTKDNVGIGSVFTVTPTDAQLSIAESGNTPVMLKLKRTIGGTGAPTSMIEVWDNSNPTTPMLSFDANYQLNVNTPHGGIINLGGGTSDANARTVVANTTVGTLVLNSATSSYNGAVVCLNGVQSSNPGQVGFISNTKYNTSGTAAYEFMTYDGNTITPVYTSRMAMNKDGKVVFGDNIMPNAGHDDRVTIQGNLAMWDVNDFDRNIRAYTDNAGINIMTNTGSTDGACMRLFGRTTPGSQGSFQFICNGTNAGQPGFNFMSYDPAANNWVGRMVINKNGQIGMGTDPTGSERLQVQNSIFLSDPADGFRTILAHSNQGGMYLSAGGGTDNGATITLNGTNCSGFIPGAMGLIADISHNTTNGLCHVFSTFDGTNYHNMMTIRPDNKVTIGDDIAFNVVDGYNLFVSKGILTERVKVALQNGTEWSDYVFAKDYQLKPLAEVDEYVKENKHLPDVPSAAEVVKDGIDMARMDAKLLQKIEELTLYVIAQDKKIDAQQKEIEGLKNK